MTQTTDKPERRLAAIFAADVAGYSRLMAEDEASTLRTLTAHREVMDGLIAQHAGRVANTAGDSVLAEFPSVVDAVECAAQVQERLAEANSAIPDDKLLSFRIGIHVGDLVVRGADLLGDGVNIAARVQALAEPGGVWLSEDAHRHLAGKTGRSFEDKGQHQVKKIARPLRVFGIAASSPDAPRRDHPKPLPLPDKPSIAVLPFTNMSDDPEQEYFADGVVDDIITALSRIKWFFVIARNSSFTYKGRPVDVRQVGRELGVRYVLEGSSRRVANKVRVTGQLIEAETGNHLWADRFDGLLDDVFELQDRMTRSVVEAIEPNLRSAEISRIRTKPTADLGAYDLYLRALSELSAYTEQTLLRAEELLRAALTRDPDYADAWAILTTTIFLRRVGGFLPLEEGARLATEAAYSAVAADPQNASALACAASVLANLGVNLDEAVEFADRAVSLSPHSAPVLTFCAVTYNFSGDFEKALSLAREALRLSPREPRGFVVLSQITTACFFSRRFAEAVEWARRNLSQHPNFAPGWRFLASALAHSGRLDEAREAVFALRKAQPNSTVTRSATTPYRHPWMVELYVDGLRKAGLPE